MKDKEGLEILSNYYDVGQNIGSGGFAVVRKGIHALTGEKVAIKILDKASLGDDLPRVSREIEALKSLEHPHIARLFQVFETDEKIYMIMEYCSGGELFDYIVSNDRLQENEGRRIFTQIASAVAYIHSKGIVHRDLKPENILLDECNDIKLIDFGLCAVVSGGMTSTKLTTCCGSPAYAAPELIKGEKYIGPQADVWSLGVLLYALLNGCLPFDDPNLSVLYQKIQQGRYEEPYWLSEGTKNILRCMLQVNPTRRLYVHQLLCHTWITQGKQSKGRIMDYGRIPFTETISSPNEQPSKEERILEKDILLKMSFAIGQPMEILQIKLAKMDYKSNETAIYLILANRKQKYGVQTFRKMPFRLERIIKGPPIAPGSSRNIQRSIDSELSDTDSVDAYSCTGNLQETPSRSYHASMEGGLDNFNLLTIGSPKSKNELEAVGDLTDSKNSFRRPQTPSFQRKSKNDVPSSNGFVNLSPAKSADCILTEIASASAKTPTREKWRNIGTPAKNTPSPSSSARRRVFGSIERGLDRFRLMLTPLRSTTRGRKLRIVPSFSSTGNKVGACNVMTTKSTDPDALLADLKSALASVGIEAEEKGFTLTGKCFSSGKAVKFRLEVVGIADFEYLGIRRKRETGDAMAYTKVIQQILSLTGIFSELINSGNAGKVIDGSCSNSTGGAGIASSFDSGKTSAKGTLQTAV